MRRLLACLPLAAAACGGGLDARVVPAMDACVAARNPVFVAGNGATALATPLPPAVDSMLVNLRYKAAFERFQEIAAGASTQAILVCALELGAADATPEARRWLQGYLQHPNEPVQAAARTLLERFPRR
jgi:hypothetical protein